MAQRLIDSKSCQSMSWAIEWGVISAALVFMGVQFWAALKIRGYAQYLDDKEMQRHLEAERRFGCKEKYKDQC